MDEATTEIEGHRRGPCSRSPAEGTEVMLSTMKLENGRSQKESPQPNKALLRKGVSPTKKWVSKVSIVGFSPMMNVRGSCGRWIGGMSVSPTVEERGLA